MALSTVHELSDLVSGAKQSVLELQVPQAPAERTAGGSALLPGVIATPFRALHRSNNAPATVTGPAHSALVAEQLLSTTETVHDGSIVRFPSTHIPFVPADMMFAVHSAQLLLPIETGPVPLSLTQGSALDVLVSLFPVKTKHDRL